MTAQLTGDAKVEIDNELNVGDLRVSKSVTGTGAQPEKDFTFTLTLEREDGVKVDHDAYEAEIATEGSQEVETFKLTRIAAGEYTFELKDGETITIKGIPTGTTYTVTETVPTADGYQQTDANAAQTGTITKATVKARRWRASPTTETCTALPSPRRPRATALPSRACGRSSTSPSPSPRRKA